MHIEASMKSKWHLFKALFGKEIISHYRYLFNTITELASYYVVFVLMFFGGKLAVGPGISETLRGLVVGYFLYVAAKVAFLGLAGNVTHEAKVGTLEQLFVTPHGFASVMGLKIVVKLFMSFAKAFVILLTILLTTGTQLNIDLLTVVVVAVPSVVSVIGIGFPIAGLALIFKRVNSLFQLVNFGILGLIGAPVLNAEFTRYLPLSLGSDMLQRSMREGVHLTEFPMVDLLTLFGVAVAYPVLGYYVFRMAEHYARAEGLMGQY